MLLDSILETKESTSVLIHNLLCIMQFHLNAFIHSSKVTFHIKTWNSSFLSIKELADRGRKRLITMFRRIAYFSSFHTSFFKRLPTGPCCAFQYWCLWIRGFTGVSSQKAQVDNTLDESPRGIVEIIRIVRRRDWWEEEKNSSMIASMLEPQVSSSNIQGAVFRKPQ